MLRFEYRGALVSIPMKHDARRWTLYNLVELTVLPIDMKFGILFNTCIVVSEVDKLFLTAVEVLTVTYVDLNWGV